MTSRHFEDPDLLAEAALAPVPSDGAVSRDDERCPRSQWSAASLGDWALLWGPVLALLTLDQVTKVLVRNNLAVGEAWAPIPALARFFTITHVQNTGVAFGQFPGLGWLFMLVNLLVLIGILVYYPRIPKGQWLMKLASVLIMAGDLGNVIDRLRTTLLISDRVGGFFTALPHASVTDFVDFKIWPVWNVADMCIVSGVTILAWVLWRAEQKAAQRDAAGAEMEHDDGGEP
ncbi:MAG: signal peptidase II [Anaerolineae bacterium]|nr:signal peptidase II [Anaerolineae bacterium]